MKTYAKRLATLAAVGVLTLGAAACGGDEEEPAAAAADAGRDAGAGGDGDARRRRAGHRRAGLGHPRALDARVRGRAAELVETLQGEGPFTVFAPTNDAFAAVGQETLDELLAPEGKAAAHRHPHLPRRAR